MNPRLIASALLTTTLCLALEASAGSMDPALERLVSTETAGCRTAEGAINVPSNATEGWCEGDEAAFAKLINQWAFAFAPSALHAARTTGFGGFRAAMEGSYTSISETADYWKLGTQGEREPATNRASVRNDAPDPFLQLYSVKLSKGFGFGLEVAATVGFMPNTSILAGGSDVRLALLEGFRKGLPGFIPDIAGGGGVRTITGTNQFQLTIASVDAQVSKPLAVGDSSILTPWVGFQYIWIFGDSGLIDMTPATDAIEYCNYTGNNLPGNTDQTKVNGSSVVHDGQPVCRGGSRVDFNNNTVFNEVRLERQRLLFGLNYRYEMITTGAQVLMDLVPPADAQNSAEDAKMLEGQARQWTLVLELGAVF